MSSGTSNWSGDYFTGTSGVAIVLNQTTSTQSAEQQMKQRSFLDDMSRIFERDWFSDYAHPLHVYVKKCFHDRNPENSPKNRDICEMDKPKGLLNDPEKS